MGFCLFNNVAVAARRALDRWGAERVLILDWDVHHGNGTNDIFHRDPDVLYVSIHESPLYPGTGPASDTGSGPGEGYTVNLPVPAGSGDAAWCSLVEHVVVLARARVPPAADPALGRLRRARARSARGLPRDARGLRADGGEHARPGRRARRAARRGARGRLRPRGAGRVDGGDARGGGRRGAGGASGRDACIRWPRRPRGGWRSAGRWWVPSRASSPAGSVWSRRCWCSAEVLWPVLVVLLPVLLLWPGGGAAARGGALAGGGAAVARAAVVVAGAAAWSAGCGGGGRLGRRGRRRRRLRVDRRGGLVVVREGDEGDGQRDAGEQDRRPRGPRPARASSAWGRAGCGRARRSPGTRPDRGRSVAPQRGQATVPGAGGAPGGATLTARGARRCGWATRCGVAVGRPRCRLLVDRGA